MTTITKISGVNDNIQRVSCDKPIYVTNSSYCGTSFVSMMEDYKSIRHLAERNNCDVTVDPVAMTCHGHTSLITRLVHILSSVETITALYVSECL